MKAPKHRESISSQYHAKKHEEEYEESEKLLQQEHESDDENIIYTHTPPHKDDCIGKHVSYAGLKGKVISVDDLELEDVHDDDHIYLVVLFENIPLDEGEESITGYKTIEESIPYSSSNLLWGMDKEGKEYV